MENMGYLLAAYTVIWAVVFAYMVFLQRKQRRLHGEITELRRHLDRGKNG